MAGRKHRADSRGSAIRGAVALGLFVITAERKHAHGRRTKPYPVYRCYKSVDNTLKVEWEKGNAGSPPSWTVSFARNHPGGVKTWADPHTFHSASAMAAWVTR